MVQNACGRGGGFFASEALNPCGWMGDFGPVRYVPPGNKKGSGEEEGGGIISPWSIFKGNVKLERKKEIRENK